MFPVCIHVIHVSSCVGISHTFISLAQSHILIFLLSPPVTKLMLYRLQFITRPQLTLGPDNETGTNSGMTTQPVTSLWSWSQTRTHPSSLPVIRWVDTWVLHVTRLEMWDTWGLLLVHDTCLLAQVYPWTLSWVARYRLDTCNGSQATTCGLLDILYTCKLSSSLPVPWSRLSLSAAPRARVTLFLSNIHFRDQNSSLS